MAADFSALTIADLTRMSDAAALPVFIVTTANGQRRWHAEDADHARDQHEDAFGGDPGEDIVSIVAE